MQALFAAPIRAACFIALLTAAGGAPAEQAFSFATTPGKLPKDVVPLSYEIRIQPDLKTLTTNGSERIEIEVRQLVDRVVLNAFELAIASASLETEPSIALAISQNQDEQTATLQLPATLRPGKYWLNLEFSGKLQAQPEGLHFVRYAVPGGAEKTLLTTQMEPTYARRVFPCWDEPVFRARFNLTAVVPQNQAAVSNTPIIRERPLADGLKEVTFAPTPAMASYLVVLVAGELEELKDSVDGIELRILTAQGKRETARYAMDVTKKALAYYNDYFASKYPLPKLDQIAVPGSIPGAMENWGGITYNESRLLYDPGASSLQTKQGIFRVVAHEISHQWFGNLVTMAWWDNLWLNEGFAQWMSSKASDRFNPEWGVWLRNHQYTEAVMSRDARKFTHPIQQPITNEAQAVDAFDEITYGKGQAFLRMLEDYLGEATFRRGIEKYIATHRFSNTTTADLWLALERASGKPVRTLAAGWTEQPGFPIVKVSSTCVAGKRRVKLQQGRFTLDDPQAASLLWKIPVALADGKSAERAVLLDKETAVFEYGDCSGVLRANAGDTGYYRVQYEQPLFDQLQTNINQLRTADRLKLLSDTWALVEAGRASSPAYLELVGALKQEKSLHVWEQILSVLLFVDQLQQGEAGRGAFHVYARALLKPELKRLGWEGREGEGYETTQLRSRLVAALGRLDDPEVLQEADRRFSQFIERPDSLVPDLREPVLFTVGRHATPAVYQQLHALARQALRLEDKQLYYHAIQQALAPELARQTLALSLIDEMPVREATSNPARVAKAGEQGTLVWDFVQHNFKALLARVSFYGRNYYVADIMDAFSDEARADELEVFVKAHLPAGAVPVAARTADAIRHRVMMKRRELPVIDQWVKSKGYTG